MKEKILFGIPPHSHVTLAMDELESLRSLGYDCHTVLYGRNDQKEGKLSKIFATVKNAVKLVNKVRRVKPDYVYLNSRFEPVGSIRDYITIRIVRLLLRKPPKIIVKSHGSDCSVLTDRSILYKRIIIPFLSKTVDAWIFLSQEERRMIENHNPQIAERASVIPNIIDPKRCFVSDIREKYNLRADSFICLYAGRLVKIKGVFDIIESISYLKSPEKFQFVFVGDGPDSEELQIKAGMHPNGDIIRFVGYLPDAECDQFYSNADILIYPTADTEGFAMALFKSVACGMPVITTPIRAAKDYLVEPDNGFWIEPERPDQIAAALQTVYENTELRESIHKNNLKVGEKFSIGVVGQQLRQIIEKTNSEHSDKDLSERKQKVKDSETNHYPLY